MGSIRSKYKTTDPFYKDKRWLRLRASALRRDGYKDQVRLRDRLNVSADTVHHIFPRDKYPEYQWCAWNLISVNEKTHESLHNRFTNELTPVGKRLMMELAMTRGIKLHMVTLVVGAPGSGKSTWTQAHMGGGIAYDMDHIAAAFRLRSPHSERHEAARKMANDLRKGFIASAGKYSGSVFIIRTAPTMQEVSEIEPDRIVFCSGQYDISGRRDKTGRLSEAEMDRLEELRTWAEVNSVETVEA